MKTTKYTFINEARVQRTIDPKLWASVSSGISKTYKNDMGASAKPIGTREQLLQRFVAGLIILKQQCPMTEKDMRNCPAFSQWSNKLVDMGINMADLHKLWNENCGNLPKVEIDGIPTNDDVNDNIIDEPVINNYPEDIKTDNTETTDNTVDNNIEKEIKAASDNTNLQQYVILVKNPEETAEALHKFMFKRNSEFFDLHGCKNTDDAFKFLDKQSLNQEVKQITNCENLDDMLNLANETGLVYALRVHGGNPEEVIGDVVWCEAKTKCSYYVIIGYQQFKVYYKEANGDLSLSFISQCSEIGLIVK